MYLVGRDLEHLSYKLLELGAGVVWHGDCQRYPKSAGGEEGGCRVDAGLKVGAKRGREIQLQVCLGYIPTSQRKKDDLSEGLNVITVSSKLMYQCDVVPDGAADAARAGALLTCTCSGATTRPANTACGTMSDGLIHPPLAASP